MDAAVVSGQGGSGQGGQDTGYARLEQQIVWYSSKSREAQRWFKRARIAQTIATAAVPVVAFGGVGWITAAVGGVALVLDAMQQMNQWQQNWISYRSTGESLKHEKYAYLGGAGVYDGLTAKQARKVLIDRVEALVSTEHTKWITVQTPKEAGKPASSASSS